jgi:hypothetical protein
MSIFVRHTVRQLSAKNGEQKRKKAAEIGRTEIKKPCKSIIYKAF